MAPGTSPRAGNDAGVAVGAGGWGDGPGGGWGGGAGAGPGDRDGPNTGGGGGVAGTAGGQATPGTGEQPSPSAPTGWASHAAPMEAATAATASFERRAIVHMSPQSFATLRKICPKAGEMGPKSAPVSLVRCPCAWPGGG